MFEIITSKYFKFTIVQEVLVAILRDFYAKFGSKMARKWRELAPFFSATATALLFLL